MRKVVVVLVLLKAAFSVIYPGIWDEAFLRYEFEGAAVQSPSFYNDSTGSFNLEKESSCDDEPFGMDDYDNVDRDNVVFEGSGSSSTCSLSTKLVSSNPDIAQGFANINATGVWSADVLLAVHNSAIDSSVIFALGADEPNTAAFGPTTAFTRMKLGMFYASQYNIGFYSYLNDKTTAFRTTSSQFEHETPLHITLISDGHNLKAYVEGVAETIVSSAKSVSYNTTYDSSLRFSVGSMSYNGRRMFNGHIFRLAVWDKQLSQDELATVISSEFSGLSRSSCPKGSRLQVYSGRGICDVCPPGSAYLLPSSNVCKVCPSGKYSLDSETCESCPEGQIVSPDKISCTQCNTTTEYTFNKTLCATCPPNSAPLNSNSQKSDCLCAKGFYGGFGEEDIGTCISCNNDPRLGCDSPGLRQPKTPDGVLVSENSNGNTTIYTCFVPKSCQNNQCADLYSGPFCGDCIPGKSFRIGTRCFSCTGSKSAIGFLYFAIALVILLATFLFLRVSVPNTAKVHAIGLTFSWFQTLALFESIPANWPNSVHSTIRVLSFANFNVEFLSPECFQNFSFWDKWALKLVLPIIILIAVGLIFLFQLYMEKKHPNALSVLSLPLIEIITRGKRTKASIFRSTYADDKFKRSRYVFFFVFLMTILYTHLSSTAFQPLNCKFQPGDGKWYLVYSPDIQCYSGEWNSKLAGVVISILLFPVGIPVAVLLVFMKFEGRIFSETFMSYFGCLTMPYHRRYYYWELVSMFRRAVMAILIDFFSRYPSLYVQIFFGTFILFMLLVAQAVAQPYKSREINLLSITWIVTAIICLFSTVVFPSASINNQEKSFFAVIVVLCIVVETVISLFVSLKESKTNKKFQAKEIEKNQLFFEIRESHVQQLKTLFPSIHSTIWHHLTQLSLEKQEKIFREISRINSKITPEDLQKIEAEGVENLEENAALASEMLSREDSTAYRPDTVGGFKALPSEDAGVIQMIVPSIREEH